MHLIQERLRHLLTAGAIGLLLAGLACSQQDESAATRPDQAAEQPMAEPTGPAPSETERAVAEPADAIQIPEGIEMPDPSVLLALRVRQPNQTLDRIARWTELAGPMGSAESLRAQLANQNIDLTQLHPDGHLGAFVWTSQPSPQSQPSQPAMVQPMPALVVPTSPDSQLAAQLERMTPPGGGLVPAGDDVIVTTNQQAMSMLLKLREGLVQASRQPLSTDFQLQIDMDQLMQTYGPMLQMQLQMMSGMIGQIAAQQQTGGPLSPADMQTLIDTQLQNVMQTMGQLDTLLVNVDLEPDAMDLSMTIRPKEGTAMSETLSGDPIAAPDLVRFTAPESYMRLQVAIRDYQQLMQTQMDLAGLMFQDPSDILKSRVQELIDQYPNPGKTIMGLGVDLSEGVMKQEMVMQVENDQQMMDMFRAMIEMTNDPDIQDIMRRNGFDISITQDEQPPRQVNGHDVHRYLMNMSMTEDAQASPATSNSSKMMEQMFGEEVPMEIVQLDDLIVYTLNQPIDDLIARINEGEAAQPLAAMQAFPGGGWLYLDYDLVKYFQDLGPLLQELGQPVPMPRIEGQASPLTLMAYHGEGAGYYRTRIPRDMVERMINALSSMQAAPPGSPPMTQSPAIMP